MAYMELKQSGNYNIYNISMEEYQAFREWKRTKMTREEAAKKIELAIGKDWANANLFVKSLEALGLIKFEEVNKAPKFIRVDHYGVGPTQCTIAVDDAIEALRRIDILCVKKEI